MKSPPTSARLTSNRQKFNHTTLITEDWIQGYRIYDTDSCLEISERGKDSFWMARLRCTVRCNEPAGRYSTGNSIILLTASRFSLGLWMCLVARVMQWKTINPLPVLGGGNLQVLIPLTIGLSGAAIRAKDGTSSTRRLRIYV